MECREIQKLLSPFIDNELGVSDTFAVAEHLEVCPSCTQEMERLRHFDEQLKKVGRISIDEFEEVRARITDTLSPWGWMHRWRGVGVAAAVMLLLAIGPQLFSAPADPEVAAFSKALVNEVQLNANKPFSLPWLDPKSLHEVLRQEGIEDIPNLAPAGFHLEGGRICYPLRHLFVQLVYRSRNEEVSLFVSRRWDRPLSGIVRREGFTIIPLGIRAVFLVTKDTLPNFVDIRQLAEEEINVLSL